MDSSSQVIAASNAARTQAMNVQHVGTKITSLQNQHFAIIFILLHISYTSFLHFRFHRLLLSTVLSELTLSADSFPPELFIAATYYSLALNADADLLPCCCLRRRADDILRSPLPAISAEHHVPRYLPFVDTRVPPLTPRRATRSSFALAAHHGDTGYADVFAADTPRRLIMPRHHAKSMSCHLPANFSTGLLSMMRCLPPLHHAVCCGSIWR